MQEKRMFHAVACPNCISQNSGKTAFKRQCPVCPSPASRQENEGHPLSQVMEDNGRVEQVEPKLFLNFIIRGVKSLHLMLAVVKINYSIVGKKD